MHTSTPGFYIYSHLKQLEKSLQMCDLQISHNTIFNITNKQNTKHKIILRHYITWYATISATAIRVQLQTP